jgi:hypothetical protein
LGQVTDTVVRHHELTASRDLLEDAMLPLPPIRTSSWSLRGIVRRLDAHTLWAFNAGRTHRR